MPATDIVSIAVPADIAPVFQAVLVQREPDSGGYKITTQAAVGDRALGCLSPPPNSRSSSVTFAPDDHIRQVSTQGTR